MISHSSISVIKMVENQENEIISECERSDWREGESPLAFAATHVHALIEKRGYYRDSNVKDEPFTLFGMKNLSPLHVSISITDIVNLDPVQESFTIKYRLFMFWELSLESENMEDFGKKALECGHYYPLKRHEVDLFLEKIPLPKLILFNNMEIGETDVLDIRIYGGEPGKKTGVLVNQSFLAVVRERFVLNDFPFDIQHLTLDFRLHDAVSWNKYQLIVDMVQFHKDCLQQLEWQVCVPYVKKGFMKTFNSYVTIPVIRKSNYFISNIVVINFILMLLGLSTFSFESKDLAGRTFITITLILTCIAFKFTALTGSIPKVSYSTILDRYINCSLWCLALMTVFTVIPAFYVKEEEDHHHEPLDETVNMALAMVSIGISVLGYVMISALAWSTRNNENKIYKEIPYSENLERPWYSFRFTNSKHLLEIDQRVSFEDSLYSLPRDSISTKSNLNISTKMKFQ